MAGCSDKYVPSEKLHISASNSSKCADVCDYTFLSCCRDGLWNIKVCYMPPWNYNIKDSLLPQEPQNPVVFFLPCFVSISLVSLSLSLSFSRSLFSLSFPAAQPSPVSRLCLARTAKASNDASISMRRRLAAKLVEGRRRGKKKQKKKKIAADDWHPCIFLLFLWCFSSGPSFLASTPEKKKKQGKKCGLTLWLMQQSGDMWLCACLPANHLAAGSIFNPLSQSRPPTHPPGWDECRREARQTCAGCDAGLWHLLPCTLGISDDVLGVGNRLPD